MTRRDFASELRREEEARLRQDWSAESASVRKRLRQGRRPKTNRAPLVFAGAALVLSLALFYVVRARGEVLGPFELVAQDGAARVMADGERVEVLSGDVSLRENESGISLRSKGPLVVERARDGVRVLRGRTEISVRHREANAAPAKVFVSGGVIEVLGTRFTIDQAVEGGSVALHEGRIRFRPAKGEPRELAPGETLRWPFPPPAATVEPPAEENSPPPAASVEPPAKESASPLTREERVGAPRAATSPSVEALLDEVDVLRGRGEYATAATKLSRALHAQPPGTQERLSFELGSILTYQLQDRRKACTHWRWHVARFSAPRYVNEVRRARETLGCPR